MKHILHVMSSIQPQESYSIKLGKAIIEKIQQKYPNSTLDELNLTELDIPHLNPESLRKLFTPADFLNKEETESVAFSNNLLQQLLAADIVVIGAPLYNFTIPSTLKAWIDHITRPGITFGYGADGRPTGLIKDKKVYVAMSSGGVYSEGAGKVNDFVVPYLQAFLGFLGMTNLTAFRAEGLKVPELKEYAMTKAINSVTID
ncbi:FMN-dependent NADH-azoreductase [Flavobacterium aquidurense]|uniref:FMN dependent NADH:quinone oxidoreductase n=1 Tax=Flavobacterium aquidurense TaxID=362413 RepID=A0A0Q0Y1N6_9FLAO|nr:NAD(P)H-dependent oxidoreductase [Flavobacterium aquidurense]KQB42641.1 FMN-dependent NADH-azoreductase [Flavobacterium aquidurense]